MENRRLSTYQSRRLLRKKRKKRTTYLWLVIFLIIGIFYYSITQKAEPLTHQNQISATESKGIVAGIVNPPQPASPLPSASPVSSPPDNSKSLGEVIDKSLEGTKGTYGVYIKNLKTGESYSLNENKSFESGSLYKLWTMAVVMKEVEDGNLAQDQELSQGIAVLNRKFGIDPENAEQTKGTITLTVSAALKQMITISHNYAALLLTEKVKLSTVAAWLKSNGFNNSKVGTDGDVPTTTPSDIALFYEKLYKGQLGNEVSTAFMFDLLKNQQLQNKLPKNLPENIEIAHKTGEIGWFSHDAGIVYTEKGEYIIAVLSESSSPKGAEERIAQLSKDVFDYFQKKY